MGNLTKWGSSTDNSATTLSNSVGTPAIKVLHVDDDSDLLSSAKQILELQSCFRVETVSTVREAIKKLSEQTFDVIVSDYQMPEKDGLTFLKELRETGDEIPFILFTGKGREEVAIKALNIGADYYLNKLGHPKTVFSQLSHYILQAVNKRKAEKRLTYKLEFESVISRISSRFVNPPDFDNAINKSLEDVGRTSGASRVWLFLLSDNQTVIKNIFEWCSDSAAPQLENLEKLAIEQISWGLDQLRDGKTIQLSDVLLLPLELNEIKEFLDNKSIRSILVLPLFLSGELGGFIGLNNVHNTEFWGPDDIALIQIFLELIGNYLERKAAYEKLQENEKTYRLLTENITDVIYIQDMNLDVTYVSPSIKTLSGYSPEEVYDLKPADFMVPESFERGIVDFKEALSLVAEKPDSEIPLRQYEYIRKDGTTFWGELRTKILLDSKGHPIGVQGVLRDVTERKETEEKLKESKEQYRLLTENITDVIFIQNLDLSIKYVSPSVETLSGYTPDEIINLGPKGLMTPESYERGLVEIQADLALSVKNLDFEPEFRRYEYMRKDGSTGWGEFKPKLLRDSKGNIVAIQGTLRDVTERKKAEDALRQEQEKFETVTGTLNVGLSVISKDYKILWANKFLTDLCGDVIGKTCHSVYNDLGNICPNCGVKEIFETGKTHVVCEQSVPAPNGQRCCIELTANPIRDDEGNIIAVSELSINIDDRKKMENRLREAEKMYRFLFDKAPVGISIADLNGCLVEFNDVAHKQLGYSREEFKKLCIADFELLETTDAINARIKQIHDTGIDEFETKYRAKNGDIRDIINMFQLVEFDGKQFLYVIARDITERKKAEDSMDRIMKELLVINEKLRVVGKLTRHDVRNKLSVISNNIYLARQQFAHNKDISKYFNSIDSAVEQVIRIFSFAQTYEQLGVEELSYIDVKKSVDEAVSLFSCINGIKFVNACSGLSVVADSLLRQIFYNFIDDSLKHGEKVSEIKVYYNEEVDHISLIYEDNGIGIPETEKEISFKEGYGKGSGYGLYLIRKICEVYGWTVNELGKFGEGVQFVIYVPKINKNNKPNYKIELD
ncbi:MAG: PAS domain S-box protein [Candidatus Bathyarchaeota archaeon]|nr:PAS domain S-box protein [Candidatus Bathyarchaeum tardum]